MQKHGAAVVFDPREARIVLVDPTTPEGTRFAEDWPEKVVLDERWAHDAMARGVCTKQAANWGGHRVYAQGSETDNQRGPSM